MARGEMLSASELAGGAAQQRDEDDGAESGLSDIDDTALKPSIEGHNSGEYVGVGATGATQRQEGMAGSGDARSSGVPAAVLSTRYAACMPPTVQTEVDLSRDVRIRRFGTNMCGCCCDNRNDIGRKRGADEYGDEDDEANGEDWEHDGDFTDDDEAAGVGDQGRLDDENPVESKSWREGTRITTPCLGAVRALFFLAMIHKLFW
jgi:hypothetical protein